MTKLTKPITITITGVGTAVILSRTLRNKCLTERDLLALADSKLPPGVSGVGASLCDQLAAQGIDWKTWEPPQPFTIDGQEVTAYSAGTVAFGEITLTRIEIEKILALSDGAMGG